VSRAAQVLHPAALAAAVVAGLLAAITMAVLHTTAARMFSILTTGRALPLVVISVLAGAAVLVLLALDKTRLTRLLAALAVTAVIWAGRSPSTRCCLPPYLTIHGAAAPAGAGVRNWSWWPFIVVLVGPSFALLYRLAQRGTLSEPGAALGHVEAAVRPGG